jgi:hypothetical protein
LGCAAILLRISTIMHCQKVIHSEGTYFTGSIRVHISAGADFRLWHIAAAPPRVGIFRYSELSRNTMST